MATVRVAQGDTNTVFAGAGTIQTSQGDVTVIFNFPSQQVQTSQLDATVLTQAPSVPVQVSQFDTEVIFRGKTYNPRLRAWTFDLDAHEFYVLNLGEGKTLVYDLSTEQWSWWSTKDVQYWRTFVGTNWTSSGDLPYYNGSNVVVGDNNYGILWMLNPEQGYDESPRTIERQEGVIKNFRRVATGQVLTTGRMTVPCYQVYLTADTGQPSYTGATVELSYSDNDGRTFNSAGSIEVQPGNYYQEFVWRSIGLVQAPGRLFRITDDGAFATINELTIYDNATSK